MSEYSRALGFSAKSLFAASNPLSLPCLCQAYSNLLHRTPGGGAERPSLACGFDRRSGDQVGEFQTRAIAKSDGDEEP